MAYQITFPSQYLDLAGVPMSTPAWEVLNLQTLLSGPSVRGSNVIIPGAAGVRPRRRRATERTVSLELSIGGYKDPEGNTHDDPVEGLVLNILELRTLTDPLATNNSVLTATLYWRDLTLTAGVQVGALEIGAALGQFNVAATLDITLISGAFSE
jgi:hypothetical protein